MPCSVTQAVVHRMTATVNHYQMGVGKGMDIIIKAGLYHCTVGVAPCKVLNCKKLQYARISCILLLTASMFHFVTSCDSAF